MHRSFWRSAAVGAAVAALLVTGCAQRSNTGSGDASSETTTAGWPETAEVPVTEGKPGGTFRLGIAEPTSIDPYNAQESEGILVSTVLFTRLIAIEPDGTPVPGVADAWEPNDDCSEWTFTLKTGTTFSNGEPVNSEAFKRGWERAAKRDAASEVAYHLEPIEGFAEIQAGKTDTLSGVDASDPKQLKIKLAANDCEFFLRTAHPVFSPTPEVAGDADNKEYNAAPIGNGPFKVEDPWKRGQGLTLVRNDDYTAGPKAYLDRVEITITPNGNDDELDGFENGSFDWARMPVPRLSQARDTYEPEGKFITKNTNGMNYLEPHLTLEPLDSVEARKAISLAIDRDAIIEGIFQGSQTPATTLVPPVFEDFYQEGLCEACHFDPKEAAALAEKAGLTPGTELKMQFNTDSGHEEWMAAVKQQLEKNLQLKVTMTAAPFDDVINNRQAADSPGLFRAAWGADYPTPGNYLTPLLKTSSIGTTDPEKPALGDNKARYSNEEFDRLVNEAAASTDPAERTRLYQQAEKIAIADDMALIPLWNRTQHRLANTEKFTNVRIDFNENPDLSVIRLK